MTIAATGPLRLGRDIRNEYAGPTSARLWRDFRRGTVYLKANSANNQAVNGSASVPTGGPIRFSHYRGQARGYTYTTAATQVTSGDHIWIHPVFGDDWNGNDWPKTYVNNGVMGSTSVNYYPCVIYQGAGIITFINNNEVQGAGGAGAVYGVAYAGGGQHCVVITQCTTKPRIINNANLRGGGGGGGWGGAGGTGGQGYYVYTAQEGPIYDGNTRVLSQPSWQSTTHNGGTYNNPGGSTFYWGGGSVGGGSPNLTSLVNGPYTYYRSTFMGGGGGGGSYNYYAILRQFAANAYTGGGGGGQGGNGGRGIGYNSANLGGTGGAGGAAGGTNAGAGGGGGTGGTGGSWGGVGNTGNTGAGGGYGNYTGWGPGGAGGSGGGANGAAIYSDSAWSLVTGGNLYGSYTGTAPT